MADIARRNQQQALRPSAIQVRELRGSEWDDILSVRRLVDRLFKRKALIFGVFLIVLVPAALATFLATPLYRSRALVQMNPESPQVLPYRDVAEAATGGGTLDTYMTTQEQILKGQTLRISVSNRLGSEYKDAPAGVETAKLADRFTVKKIENSQLYELDYVAPSPDAAATVVNLFAEEYIKQNFEMRQATRVKAEQDLEKELRSLEARLQLSEKELMSYAQQNDILSIEQGQVDPLQDRLSFLTQDLGEAESRQASAQTSLDSLRKASVNNFPERLVTEQIGQLEGNLLTLEQDLTTLRSTFGENWPAVVDKRNEIALVRDQLNREKTTVLSRSLEQARLDVEGADARRNLASQALSEQKDLVNRFHTASIEYNNLKREVDTNRNLYDGLLERLRQTGVIAGFQFGNIQLVEPGRPSGIVDSPNVIWNLALASLLGLSLGVCVVILLDFWDNSISTVEEVEQLTSFANLGTVPLIKPARASSTRLLPGRRAESTLPSVQGAGQAEPVQFELTESIRTICASLLLSRSDERPRVVVVTSATQGEGKTTLVGHLGKAFADAGSRTLVVEADLRKGDLSRSFRIGNEDGLSLFLAGHVAPWPRIHQTEIANLFLVAGGPVPPNPAALLHSEKLTDFLNAAASEYDVVIVDAPPLLSMADARILGSRADGVVLVVRAGRTARNLIRRAWGLLEVSGANVLGTVLNGSELEPAESSYYGYQYQKQA